MGSFPEKTYRLVDGNQDGLFNAFDAEDYILDTQGYEVSTSQFLEEFSDFPTIIPMSFEQNGSRFQNKSRFLFSGFLETPMSVKNQTRSGGLAGVGAVIVVGGVFFLEQFKGESVIIGDTSFVIFSAEPDEEVSDEETQLESDGGEDDVIDNDDDVVLKTDSALGITESTELTEWQLMMMSRMDDEGIMNGPTEQMIQEHITQHLQDANWIKARYFIETLIFYYYKVGRFDDLADLVKMRAEYGGTAEDYQDALVILKRLGISDLRFEEKAEVVRIQEAQRVDEAKQEILVILQQGDMTTREGREAIEPHFVGLVRRYGQRIFLLAYDKVIEEASPVEAEALYDLIQLYGFTRADYRYIEELRFYCVREILIPDLREIAAQMMTMTLIELLTLLNEHPSLYVSTTFLLDPTFSDAVLRLKNLEEYGEAYDLLLATRGRLEHLLEPYGVSFDEYIKCQKLYKSNRDKLEGHPLKEVFDQMKQTRYFRYMMWSLDAVGKDSVREQLIPERHTLIEAWEDEALSIEAEAEILQPLSLE